MLLRPAEPADALAVARVHVRAWQAGYRGLLPDDYLNQLRPEDRASKYDLSNLNPLHPHTVVAVDGNRGNVVVGFATTAASREPDLPHHGELTALYVDPDRWGLGIGGALVSAARAHLVSLGRRQAYLFTLVGNLRAQRFYQSDLWLTDGLRRAETVWNIPVDVFRFQRNL
jgi:ribosomal protein S18 acetylase RimI-like enzyme